MGTSTYPRRPEISPLRLEQSPANGVPGDLGDIAHSELLQDICPVVVHGLTADHQLGCDLVTGVSLGDELDDLELAGGEWILWVRLAAPRLVQILTDQRRDGPW